MVTLALVRTPRGEVLHEPLPGAHPPAAGPRGLRASNRASVCGYPVRRHHPCPDLDDDVAGINASLELIRRTRGGSWPEEAVTAEFNFVDLVWHECEFRDGYSFSYVLRDADGGYLGCAYLYPMGRRAELTEELAQHDVDVSWWVTEAAYEAGYYDRAFEALRRWVSEDFPFTSPYFSNLEIADPHLP